MRNLETKLTVTASMTVYALKSKLEQSTDTTVKRQRLYLRQTLLEDDRMLAEYRLKSGDILQLLVAPEDNSGQQLEINVYTGNLQMKFSLPADTTVLGGISDHPLAAPS